MSQAHLGLLLVDYYEGFLKDRDLEVFRERVLGRYTEATLGRILTSSPHPTARRAAVLALGMLGTYEVANAPLGRALRDDDPVVRTMAESALWAVWFRADTPENNRTLDQVKRLINQQRFDTAVELATRLIGQAPRFAEAYNQRAIAYFLQGRYAESAADCERVLQLNPYHFGAWSGLAQCQACLQQPRQALHTLRRALKLQPHSQGLRQSIELLESQIESEGPR